MSILLYALLAFFVILTGRANGFNSSTWIDNGWQAALGVPHPDGAVSAPAMEMDIWGNPRATEVRAPPSREYDEDVIVNLMTEIYKTLLRLGPMEDSKVTWPPSSGNGHALDLSKIPNDVAIDPRVLSLMRRLPVCREYNFEFVPNQAAVDFLTVGGMKKSRLLDERNLWFLIGEEGARPIWAKETAVMLFHDNNENMPLVVLDVADNTIRNVHDAEFLSDAYTETEKDPQKLEDYQCDYVNWPAMPAHEYLQSMLRNYREGIWIPTDWGSIQVLDPDPPAWAHDLDIEMMSMTERRRLLMEVYGWPNEFREEAWKREVLGMERYEKGPENN